MNMQNIIETTNLTKYYKNGVVGIENLSLTVREGEIYGFLGSNGAGKTTTIRILMNLIFQTSGRAQIFGKDCVKQRLEICKDIGYLPSAVIPHRYMTGEGFLDYMGKLSGNGNQTQRRYLLDRFEFSERDFKRKVKDYSTGMARKIGIIQALQTKPRLLIMDEPTEGLDPVMQNTFYELIREYRDQGSTVFLSSHHLLEVEQICDRAGIIRNGHLVAVEKINDLARYKTRKIWIEFKSFPDRAELDSPLWEIMNLTDNSLEAKITGDIDSIIKMISKFNIRDMSISNPNLHEIFMSYYQENPK